jgi:hypothetical protein
MRRRDFLLKSFLSSAGLSLLPTFSLPLGRSRTATTPIRAITKGPKVHWFGYYDKYQFDASGRYVLGMAVDFESRSPTAEDKIEIGLIDLADRDKWTRLGESSAWGWQQGCMLQWVPGKTDEVIWNDCKDGQLVSRILNYRTGALRTLPKPVYALDPSGRWAIGTEFSRIQKLRPGYGYASVADPDEKVKASAETGLYTMDLVSGENKMLFSLADIASIPYQEKKDIRGYWHWFNHLLVNTDGSRFTFLHRWREHSLAERPTGNGFVTRMFTADAEGNDLYEIDPSGFTSHFVWRDPSHICAFTKPAAQEMGFYLITDKTGHAEQLGRDKMPTNGHQTYLPNHNNEWLVSDSYPLEDRLQHLYLYHIPTDRRVDLGKFHSPTPYTGEWRCDLHPRSNRAGDKIVIDSTHGGNGRQMYLIDIGDLS